MDQLNEDSREERERTYWEQYWSLTNRIDRAAVRLSKVAEEIKHASHEGVEQQRESELGKLARETQDLGNLIEELCENRRKLMQSQPPQ